MTRIDMSTREWHELIRPVLPHTINDKDYPELDVIRLELGETALYAIATDRTDRAASGSNAIVVTIIGLSIACLTMTASE